MKKPLSRRALLHGAGSIAIGLPLLDAMSAGAATVPVKRKLITFFSPCGTVGDGFNPTGADTTSSEILAPLAAHKADLLVLGGLHLKSAEFGPGNGNHQRGINHLWTGTECVLVGGSAWGGGPSLDQVVAKKVSVSAGGAPITKFKSLDLQIGEARYPGANFSHMCFSNPGQAITPNNNPYDLFRTVFAGVGGGPAVDTLIAQRRSILDTVRADFSSLKSKLGAADQQRVGTHLDAIRDIELRLTTVPPASCVAPTQGAPIDYRANANYPAVSKLMIDLTVKALSCDLTRVVSLQYDSASSTKTFTWAGLTRGHHDMSHDKLPPELPASATPAQRAAAEVSRSGLVAINSWYAGQLAYLIAQLKLEGGTLFHDTVVAWGNELANGHHKFAPTPFVLAGTCGGVFRPGRFLTFTDLPHNDLLCSLYNAMTGESTVSFGNPTYCTGPLAGLT